MRIFDRKTLEILEVNDAATETYGYSRTEFLKMTFWIFVHQKTFPKCSSPRWERPEAGPLRRCGDIERKMAQSSPLKW